MTFYEKNLQAINKIDPVLSVFLQTITENKNFEVFMDKNDDVNINIYDKERDFIFYQTKPVDEVVSQYENIMEKYSRYPLFWLYGVSNGLLVKMLLNLGKYIYVFEPNLELIYIALNLFDFSKEIEEKKLRIMWTKNINFNTLNALCKNPDIKVFLKLYFLEITNDYYYQFFSEDIKQLNHNITFTIKDVITKDGNDAKDSLIGLNHHLKHIPQMINSYPLTEVVKNKNTENAVIVSTGPSLAKQLPLLKKYQDYLTILCIDASLPILQKEGIKPDFVFSLERVEATSKFFENLDREFLKDTIFAPTSISHPKTLQNIGNMKKMITMRPFGYTNMFRLDKWGYIGIGMSAANMAFDFAYVAKFKNITFIGQDLAFSEDGKTHSKGAIFGENEKQYQKNTLYVKGYYGNQVKTSKTWVLFLNSFKTDIAHVIKEGVNVYNCTEGGAYIDGAKHIPFEEFLSKIDITTPKNPIKCELISEKKQSHYLKRSKKLIELYIKRLEWIKSEVEKTFLSVMEKIENLEQLNRDKDLEKIDFDELANTISEIDKIKDIYEEDKGLRRFANITSPYIVSAELELARIMVRNSETEIEKKVKMIDWIYEHKSWLFFLAGALENILFILKNNYKEIYKEI